MSIGIDKSLGLVAKAGPEIAKLKKATDGFEGIFVKKLLSEMRKSIHSESSDKAGSEIYDDMMDQAVADATSKSGMFGISKVMFRDFAPKIIAMLDGPHNQVLQNANPAVGLPKENDK